MKNKEQNRAIKKATIHTLDVIIEHADKGPSGFWTGDQEDLPTDDELLKQKLFPSFVVY